MLTVMGPWEKGCLQQSVDVALGAHDPQAWSQCGFQLSLLDSEPLNESAIRPEFCSKRPDAVEVRTQIGSYWSQPQLG